jgi:hypothetical protein
MDLTNEMMVARSVVSHNATAMAQLRIMTALNHASGINNETFLAQLHEYEEQFPAAVKDAKRADPDVPWEVCVDVAVQHEVHKFHLIFPGTSIGAALLAASRSMAMGIRILVYMSEKSESVLQ